jgi:hypothetical protein
VLNQNLARPTAEPAEVKKKSHRAPPRNAAQLLSSQLNCDQCDYYTYHSGKLQDHKSNEHEQKEKPRETCPDCDLSLSSVLSLKNHMRNLHQPTPEPKKYHCNIKGCRLLFESKQEMHKHKLDDHPSSCYLCDDCGELFELRYKFMAHKRKTHGDPGKENDHLENLKEIHDKLIKNIDDWEMIKKIKSEEAKQ